MQLLLTQWHLFLLPLQRHFKFLLLRILLQRTITYHFHLVLALPYNIFRKAFNINYFCFHMAWLCISKILVSMFYIFFIYDLHFVHWRCKAFTVAMAGFKKMEVWGSTYRNILSKEWSNKFQSALLKQLLKWSENMMKQYLSQATPTKGGS